MVEVKFKTSYLLLLTAVLFLYYGPSQRQAISKQLLPSTDSQRAIEYVVQAKNKEAVDMLKQLANPPQNDKCGLQVDCKYYFESALFGAYCSLTTDQVKKLRSCMGEEIQEIQKDGIVRHQAWSRSLRQVINNQNSSEGIDYFSIYPETELDVEFSSQIISLPNTSVDVNEDELKFVTMELQASFLGPIQRAVQGDTASQQIAEVGYKNWQLPDGLWNLDRIDQRQMPLNSRYSFGGIDYVGTGKGVTVYVVDSGVKDSHVEFKDWFTEGSRASSGIDTIDNDMDADDCDGHGTHVASVVNGKGVGVAKQADVVGVRVLDCQGQGKTGNLIAGLDWVSANLQKPAIVTLSLGLEKNDEITRVLEQTIRNMVQQQQVTFIVASGNSDQNSYQVTTSCDVSPAHMPEVVTVAASDLQTKFGFYRLYLTDNRENVYYQSNTGPCVDIFAPGVDIYAACGGYGRCQQDSDFAYAWQSGTSMAVPHVAGAAAIFLSEVPWATPAEVKQVLIGTSTPNRLSTWDMQANTPNNMLYTNIQDMVEYYNQLQYSNN